MIIVFVEYILDCCFCYLDSACGIGFIILICACISNLVIPQFPFTKTSCEHFDKQLPN